MPELPSSLRGVTNWPKTICCSIRLILGINLGPVFSLRNASFLYSQNRWAYLSLLDQIALSGLPCWDNPSWWFPTSGYPKRICLQAPYSSSQQMLQQSMTMSYSQLKVPWNLQAPYPPAAKLAQPALAQALFIPPKRSACLSWIHPWNAFQISPCIHHIYSEKIWKGKMTPGS